MKVEELHDMMNFLMKQKLGDSNIKMCIGDIESPLLNIKFCFADNVMILNGNK